MITVGGSDHPAFTGTMFGETLFYDSHAPDRVLAILDELGFEPLIAEFMNLPTGGRDKGRYGIVAETQSGVHWTPSASLPNAKQPEGS